MKPEIQLPPEPTFTIFQRDIMGDYRPLELHFATRLRADEEAKRLTRKGYVVRVGLHRENR